ncbi:MAG: S8 family serine peptidase [Oceanococcaceae bacterium]
MRSVALLGAALMMLGACTGGRSIDTPSARAADLIEVLRPTDRSVLTDAGVAVDRDLLRLLESTPDDQQIEVLVSFHGKEGVQPEQVDFLESFGLQALYMRYLPIAGVLATPVQILQLMDQSQVRSLWHNAELQYEDQRARAITSVSTAEEDPVLSAANGRQITGRGVTILVNDSGIDATHGDLLFGEKVLANALGHTNLRSYLGSQPFTPTEGVPNTDVGGSHGTHVAGIAAGDGRQSDGRYEGSAKGAWLAGYGSGATLLVLDSTGGFDYALHLLATRPELNLRIVTNSFGSTSDQGTVFDPNDPTNIATKILADRGLIVVFSAGNSGSGPDSITGNYKKAPWITVAANGTKEGGLAGSSSRGAIADGVYTVQVDGATFTVEDRPTVVAPGTDIIAARARAADPFTPLDLLDDTESGEIAAQDVPFYTYKTGTSMAAPHLAGLIALLLEANPSLTWQSVKHILKTTATNMPGFDAWEVGAGYANVEAALAMALSLRRDYGSTNQLFVQPNAYLPIEGVLEDPYSIDFLPAGPTGAETFEVGADVAIVIAYWNRPDTSTCTCAVTLTNPDGVVYRSGAALPVLSPRVAAAAPAKAGTWTVSVRGLTSLSGVALDPTGLTNGPSAPGTVDLVVEQYLAGEPVGLDDIVGHPEQAFIEKAVFEHLVDARDDNAGFQPDALLTRAEFAQYLMAWGVRQTRDHVPRPVYSDVAGARLTAAAEATTSLGALILDNPNRSRALIELEGSAFGPNSLVTREEVAYALVQALGRETEASSRSGQIMVSDGNGDQQPVSDADEISESRRGHVADAAILGIIDAEREGRRYYLYPQRTVSRAEFARMSVKAHALLP